MKEAKEEYMRDKAEVLGDKKDDAAGITDQDLVPFQLLDNVLSKRWVRLSFAHDHTMEVIWNSQEEIIRKEKELKIENNKVKKIIESNVTVNHLNEVISKG